MRAIAEDRGFQSDVSDIQTETEQTCQAELNTETGKVWCIICMSVISVISEIDISVIMCIIMS